MEPNTGPEYLGTESVEGFVAPKTGPLYSGAILPSSFYVNTDFTGGQGPASTDLVANILVLVGAGAHA